MKLTREIIQGIKDDASIGRTHFSAEYLVPLADYALAAMEAEAFWFGGASHPQFDDAMARLRRARGAE